MISNSDTKRTLLVAWLGLASALASGQASATDASAIIKDQDGETVGKATLRDTPNGVLIHVKFYGLPAGAHAFHVHETGICEPPFKSAGGHYNPTDSAHGFLIEDGPHAGDMPNIHVPGDQTLAAGNGSLELEVLTLVDSLENLMDEDGAALVVHEGTDDYKSQPSGAAGPRIACGVIEAR